MYTGDGNNCAPPQLAMTIYRAISKMTTTHQCMWKFAYDSVCGGHFVYGPTVMAARVLRSCVRHLYDCLWPYAATYSENG